MSPKLENNTLPRSKFFQKWKHKSQCLITNKKVTFFGGPELVWS